MTFSLVRGLLQHAFVLRLAAISVLFLSLTSNPASAQTPDYPHRDHIVRMLQQLVTTGYPLDNEHDDGEWLQRAVEYAFYRRDREIEQLAMRAAVPLRARVTAPVSATEAPAVLEVISYTVLKLPRPVGYVAWLEASLDGGAVVELGSQASGSPRTIDLRRLGESALRPGTHHISLRARLDFGDRQQPIHTEVRELAPIAYAIYDRERAAPVDQRWFVYGPAAMSARDLDPMLPEQPLLTWLTGVVASRADVADHRMWTTRYCSELTDEHHAAHDAGGICTVIYFSGHWLGQLWFRTGHVETSETGFRWYPAERPSFEALFLSSGHSASRLSDLPGLLERLPRSSDQSLALPEIVISPAAPKRAAPAKATITLQNTGDTAIQNVILEVIHIDGANEGGFRHFLVDVPAYGSTSVSLDVSFRTGYGLIVALPFIKDHGIAPDFFGPPLEAPCAARVVNPAAAPRDYLRKNVGHTHCISR